MRSAEIPPSTRVVPLAFMAPSQIGFGIRGAINRALAEGRIRKPSTEADRELRDLLLGLNIKRTSISVIAERVTRNWHAVRERALQRARELDGYALDGARMESRELV